MFIPLNLRFTGKNLTNLLNIGLETLTNLLNIEQADKESLIEYLERFEQEKRAIKSQVGTTVLASL